MVSLNALVESAPSGYYRQLVGMKEEMDLKIQRLFLQGSIGWLNDFLKELDSEVLSSEDIKDLIEGSYANQEKYYLDQIHFAKKYEVNKDIIDVMVSGILRTRFQAEERLFNDVVKAIEDYPPQEELMRDTTISLIEEKAETLKKLLEEKRISRKYEGTRETITTNLNTLSQIYGWTDIDTGKLDKVYDEIQRYFEQRDLLFEQDFLELPRLYKMQSRFARNTGIISFVVGTTIGVATYLFAPKAGLAEIPISVLGGLATTALYGIFGLMALEKITQSEQKFINGFKQEYRSRNILPRETKVFGLY